MSENSSGGSCAGCCLRILFWVIVFSLIFVWCERKDGKDFIDSSIEQVHHWYSHAESVWNGNDTAQNIESNGR